VLLLIGRVLTQFGRVRAAEAVTLGVVCWRNDVIRLTSSGGARDTIELFNINASCIDGDVPRRFDDWQVEGHFRQFSGHHLDRETDSNTHADSKNMWIFHSRRSVTKHLVAFSAQKFAPFQSR
jgi:hypothetical protein